LTRRKGENSDLGENHGGDFLWRENLLFSKILDLDHRIATLINDLERPGLDILLDRLIVEAATNQTPKKRSKIFPRQYARQTHLTSKTVLVGFMAA
jgi:hypothetical protein